MPTLTESVEGVYLLIAVYATAAIIMTAVLIIEIIDWYISGKTKTITTNATNAIEMSITTVPTAESTSTQPSTTDPYIRILPIIMYICYISSATTTVLSRFAVGIHNECNYLGIEGFWYMAAKSCLYLVFLYRLFKVYSGCTFAKSTTILKIAAVITVFWAIFIGIFNFFTIEGVIVIINDNRYCTSASAPVAILIMMSYDIILNLGCCYAFTRPLLWLSNMNERSCELNGIYEAVIRYIVLTVVEVLSTFLIALVSIILQSNDVFLLDMALNCVCIMLFNSNYHRLYHCICCGPHKIGHKIIEMKCCCKTQSESDTDPKA